MPLPLQAGDQGGHDWLQKKLLMYIIGDTSLRALRAESEDIVEGQIKAIVRLGGRILSLGMRKSRRLGSQCNDELERK